MDTVNTSSNETLVHEAVGAAVVGVVATVAGTLAQMALRAIRGPIPAPEQGGGPAPSPHPPRPFPRTATQGERKRLRPAPVREGPRRHGAPYDVWRGQTSGVSRCPDAPERPGSDGPAPGPATPSRKAPGRGRARCPGQRCRKAQLLLPAGWKTARPASGAPRRGAG